MDGYAITATGAEALAAFGLEGVRHAARLDSGEGFVAFDGLVPPVGGVVFEVVEDAIPWLVPQVRRRAIQPEDRDHLGLFDSAAFRRLPADQVVMASALTNDTILAVTVDPQPTARWSATSVEWLDVRATQAILA